MNIVTQIKANTSILLFKQLRPKQWTKNLLIFAAPLFSYKILVTEAIIHSLAGFFLFCFVSGCVYILNDYIDIESDRNHPDKCHRPMASGQLNPNLALVFGILLLSLSLLIGFYLDTLFGFILVMYLLLNIGYSFKLKHVVIIDVMIIASGFVLRAIGGGVIIDVPFTPWFLLCTMLLALFLAVSKRRQELLLLEKTKGTHRKVLDNYSSGFLDQINSIVTTSTVISYAIFTFTSGHTIHLMWTIPIVLYGIFRYLYLIHIEEKGESPERLLIEDKHLLVTVILYALTVFIVLYCFD